MQSQPIHLMCKPRASVCNLDCKYCYYLQKEELYPDSNLRMDDATLERYTSEYIAAQDGDEVVFSWQGGEPLLQKREFYERAVQYQQRYARPGMRIYNTLQTNGTLLDENWCHFFKEHDFLLGISLDGPQELHDAYRVDKRGAPTFAAVMRGLALAQQHDLAFNLLCCVHAANADHPLQVYRFLREQGPHIQFIPILEKLQPQVSFPGQAVQVSARSLRPRQFADFHIAVFDEWVKHDVGQVFVQLFDVALGLWLGDPASLCVFAETCGNALALEHNGDVYACDHYVDPGYLRGNLRQSSLRDLALNAAQQEFGQNKQTKLPQQCRQCPMRFACNGGCPKDRILLSRDGEPGLNYFCEGYFAFFQHVDPALRRMVALLQAQASPALIMQEGASVN